MARSRNIKPGFFKNEVLAGLDPHTRLLFAGLWTLADREGRFEVRLEKIKAEIFPYEQVMLESCMAHLWINHFLTFYEGAGKRICQINNWHRHQSPHHKEVASELPPCETEKSFADQDDIHAWLKHDPYISQSRFKQNGSCPTDSLNRIPDSLNPCYTAEGESDKSKPSKPKKPITDDFQVTREMLAWVEERGYGNVSISEETERFIDHWKAKGEARADWVASWRTWIRNADRYQREAAGARGGRDAVSAAIHGHG